MLDLGLRNLFFFSCAMCSHKQWTTAGFTCPRCGCKVCDLPTECPVCSLTLISSPHLARTYHHLFPLDVFTECTPFDAYGTGVVLA